MTAYCQQWCPPNTTLIGPDGNQPTTETVGECGKCRRITRWLSREVLPSIRRHGYYAPTGSALEVEMQAMIAQDGLRGELNEGLRDLLGCWPLG